QETKIIPIYDFRANDIQELVRYINGRIKAIRLNKELQPPPSPLCGPKSAKVEAVGGTMKAVLIGDHAEEIGNIQQVLEKMGFLVSQLSNGREVLEFARDHQPELVMAIGSMKLPDMSGYELMDKLRTDYPDPPIVRIVVLGEPTDENVLKSFIVNMDATL